MSGDRNLPKVLEVSNLQTMYLASYFCRDLASSRRGSRRNGSNVNSKHNYPAWHG